jgi:hypothetical protein
VLCLVLFVLSYAGDLYGVGVVCAHPALLCNLELQQGELNLVVGVEVESSGVSLVRRNSASKRLCDGDAEGECSLDAWYQHMIGCEGERQGPAVLSLGESAIAAYVLNKHTLSSKQPISSFPSKVHITICGIILKMSKSWIHGMQAVQQFVRVAFILGEQRLV